MRSTWGDKLGLMGRPKMGSGIQAPPQPVAPETDIHYTNFRNGLMLAERPEDVPSGYFSRAIDVESTRRDGIIRAPGVTLVENTVRAMPWLFVHASFDFQSVLISINAPYIGVKEAGNFIWTDVGLDTYNSNWVSSLYGDVLLISNGRVSYARDFDSGVVTLVPEMPGAATLFTAFGRIFAGGVINGGDYNVLGVMWNSVVSDYTDWTGIGSGAELLIADVPAGDRIIAGRILSFDTVAILCRRSIWNANRTNVAERPADFQFRLVGIGCVSEPTARSTESGVTFLSDEGVRHYNGQDAPIISSAINPDILPIDFSQLAKYKAAWDSSRRRYILCTPTGTYIYQFPSGEYPQGAWFKRSLVADNVISFAQQTDDLTWDDMGSATWNDMTQIWAELATPETIGDMSLIFVKGTKYGLQDYANPNNFSTPLIPAFTPRPAEPQLTDMPEELLLIQAVQIEYLGEGIIEIYANDEAGNLALVTAVDLPLAARVTQMWQDLEFSCQTAEIEVRIVSGSVELLKIREVVQSNGPVISTPPSLVTRLLYRGATINAVDGYQIADTGSPLLEIVETSPEEYGMVPTGTVPTARRVTTRESSDRVTIY